MERHFLKISGFSCVLIILILTALFISTGDLKAQVKLTEKDWVLPTYPVADPDPNPIFFKNEAYQGASRHYYPLALNDQYTGERIEQAWQTLVLENEYIELAITPELGGKLYYATDKTNNYHFVYKNNVVKPSNIGMTGAWVSGGIEWCVLHHHRASTYLPVDYTTTENADGSKTIWVGEYEPRHGMRWTIGVTVFPGKSYFRTEGRIYNASPLTHTFLFWANVAAHTNEQYQTIFPPSAQVVTFHSKTDFARWPVSHEVFRGADFTSGVDISWWKNVTASNSFFVHELQEDFMGGYDHGKKAGTVHIGDHNIVRGAKLWEWGSGPRGQATEGRLTENDGPYVEIMVGAYSDNQPDYSWIRPYEVKTWEQYWYPIRGIGGFKYANLNGAVNLEKKGEQSVFLGYYSTSLVPDARIVLKKGDVVVFEERMSISPEKEFAREIKLAGTFDLTELHTQLLDAGTGNVLVEYQPLAQGPVDELPEPWGGYKQPAELETVEELFLTGQRVEQFYAPRYDQMDWYMEALRRDPGDIRTNTAVGNNYLKNGDYENARKYLARAIKRLTGDYTRPSSGEALYLQGLTLKALGLLDEAVDTLFRSTWDYAWHSAGYYQLAQISVMRGDIDKAMGQIEESLATNVRNNRGIALKASLLRLKGDHDEAMSVLKPVLKRDPLDFRARNEVYLCLKAQGKTGEAGEVLASLNKEMRGFHENYLDVAVGYLNDGLLSEAAEVLQRYEGGYPIIDYYLGYICSRQGQLEKALEHYRNAARKPVENVFPHRLETVEVLKNVLELNPADGKANYYIGNILFEKQPDYAIQQWKYATSKNPDLAVAFRNLGWGYYRHLNDVPQAIGHYEKAIGLNRNEAIYFSELDALYEMNNTPVATRLKLFEGSDDVVRNRDDAFIRLVEVYNLAGQPAKAVQLLDGVEFAYREGSSRVREVIIDAKLSLGNQYLREKDHQNALKYFLDAQIPDEEAGSARFGNRDIQVNYYIGLAYEALGKKRDAAKYFRKSADKAEGRTSSVMDYYLGLNNLKLGNKDKAVKVFEHMVNYANQQLAESRTSETGVIFGEREAENTRNSRLLTIRGLGYKGLDRMTEAREDLKKAVDLSYSNFWAKYELDN